MEKITLDYVIYVTVQTAMFLAMFIPFAIAVYNDFGIIPAATIATIASLFLAHLIVKGSK